MSTNTPPFSSLPVVENTNLRIVDGMAMDVEQYQVEGWHVDGFYVQEGGTKVPYWRATLSGLRAYSKLSRDRRAEKKRSWQTREEEDAAFRDYVDALVDAKPGGRP